jgi:hypothetical protein
MAYLLERYLAPSDRFAEILCGLVMILTFTLAGSVSGADVRDIAIGAAGCAIAWGVIDGVTLAFNAVFQRGRRNGVLREIRTLDRASAIGVLRAEFDATLAPLAGVEDRDRIYAAFVDSASTMHEAPVHFTKADLYGALSLVLIEAACALFVVLPVLALGTTMEAIRVSNVLLICTLFAIGYDHARRNGWTVARSVRTGLVIMSVGVCLVLVAIVMGG